MPKNIFGTSQNALPDLDEVNIRRFDFYSILSRWGDVFGDQNITARVYERDQLVGGDVVKDFLSINNIPEFGVPNILSNTSRGREITLVNFVMQSLGISKGKKQVINQFLDKSGKLMPSSQECEEFYNKFKEGNKHLNERFNVSTRPYTLAMILACTLNRVMVNGTMILPAGQLRIF